MGKIVTIHQPEHLCWLGLIDKISKADTFVIMDDVWFRKNYFQNRNKIKTQTGWQWLTVPIQKYSIGTKIKDIKISYNTDWQKKYLKTLEFNYKKAPYFNTFYPFIEAAILGKYAYLSDLNCILLGYVLDTFDVSTDIQLMSDLKISEKLNGSDKCLEICKKLKADTYLSGVSGKDYLQLDKFKNAGIDVKFHSFFHPVYSQQFGVFMAGLSSIDYLMNMGKEEFTNSKGKNSLKEILKNYKYKGQAVLELFGGSGMGHLKGYANNCNNLTIWEINAENCLKLKVLYPKANILNVDTLKQLQIEDKKFDILILDPPANMAYDKILPTATRLLNNKGTLIFRAIKKSYNNCSNVLADKTLEYYDELFKKEFVIKNRYKQVREYYFLEDWLYNYVYELERK